MHGRQYSPASLPLRPRDRRGRRVGATSASIPVGQTSSQGRGVPVVCRGNESSPKMHLLLIQTRKVAIPVDHSLVALDGQGARRCLESVVWDSGGAEGFSWPSRW